MAMGKDDDTHIFETAWTRITVRNSKYIIVSAFFCWDLLKKRTRSKYHIYVTRFKTTLNPMNWSWKCLNHYTGTNTHYFVPKFKVFGGKTPDAWKFWLRLWILLYNNGSGTYLSGSATWHISLYKPQLCIFSVDDVGFLIVLKTRVTYSYGREYVSRFWRLVRFVPGIVTVTGFV